MGEREGQRREKDKGERRAKEREGVGEREGMAIKGREVGGIMYIWQTEE